MPRLVGLVAALVCAAFVVHIVHREWSIARQLVVNAHPGWLALGWALALAAMAAMAVAWRSAQDLAAEILGPDQAPPLGWFDTVTLYFEGELGKYVPGAIWAAVGRAELARRCGLPRFAAYAGVTLSLLALYLACGLLATGALLLQGDDRKLAGAAWVLMVLPVAFVMLHPRPLGRILAWIAKHTRQPLAAPSRGHTTALILAYIPAWLMVAAATACIARSLRITFDVREIVLATVLAWLAGFLVVGAPGGIGVREAVFVSVASSLQSGGAVTVAVLARFAFITADASGALLSHVARRLRRDAPQRDAQSRRDHAS